MKLCKRCGKDKDAKDFYADNRSRDKLQYICKDCENERIRLRKDKLLALAGNFIPEKTKDLSGMVFGKLRVLSIHSRTRNGHIRWNCICECGKEKSVLGTHLVQKKTKSCGCATPLGKDRKDWRGYEEISGKFWHHLQIASRKSKSRAAIEFSITIEYIYELYLRQNRRCALSGVPLSVSPRWNEWGTASLDRIDSSLGYIVGNVQWVHKDINKMKNAFSQEYFIEMCHKVFLHNPVGK